MKKKEEEKENSDCVQQSKIFVRSCQGQWYIKDVCLLRRKRMVKKFKMTLMKNRKGEEGRMQQCFLWRKVNGILKMSAPDKNFMAVKSQHNFCHS